MPLRAAAAAASGDSGETDALRSKLRARELEVSDLSETVDRLRCEKEDLETEVGELSRRMNAEDIAASSDDSRDNVVEAAVYDEPVVRPDLVRDGLARDAGSRRRPGAAGPFRRPGRHIGRLGPAALWPSHGSRRRRRSRPRPR